MPAEKNTATRLKNITHTALEQVTQINTLHSLVETQSHQRLDAIAVVIEEHHLTYAALESRANQLAWYLRGLGAQRGTLVGIFAERSLEMVVALYAAMKAGGAYVPIDPTYPAQRVTFMLHDSQVPVLLTQAHLRPRIPSYYLGQIISLETDWPRIGQLPSTALSSPQIDEDLAYVIYTSGSTGKPKGAMNTHRGICNRLLWMQEAYGLQPEDRVLQKTPFSFDVSVWEFFWPLLTGARLILALPNGHRDSTYLRDLIQREGITTLHFVPSMLETFLHETGVQACCNVIRRVFSSGEALSGALQARFFARLPTVELHNLYGPTEASVDVTAWTCNMEDPAATVPIGRPITNIQIHILNEDYQSVPIGVAGELHIAGVGLAQGYLQRPALTAEKFIPDPVGTRTWSPRVQNRRYRKVWAGRCDRIPGALGSSGQNSWLSDRTWGD